MKKFDESKIRRNDKGEFAGGNGTHQPAELPDFADADNEWPDYNPMLDSDDPEIAREEQRKHNAQAIIDRYEHEPMDERTCETLNRLVYELIDHDPGNADSVGDALCVSSANALGDDKFTGAEGVDAESWLKDNGMWETDLWDPQRDEYVHWDDGVLVGCTKDERDNLASYRLRDIVESAADVDTPASNALLARLAGRA